MILIILFMLMNLHIFANKTLIINKFLQRLEENWKSIVDNFQEGLIIFNKDFKILYKNKSMKAIFGYEEGTIAMNRKDNKRKERSAISITVHTLKIIPRS